jgi:hypothetical protein
MFSSRPDPDLPASGIFRPGDVRGSYEFIPPDYRAIFSIRTGVVSNRREPEPLSWMGFDPPGEGFFGPS